MHPRRESSRNASPIAVLERVVGECVVDRPELVNVDFGGLSLEEFAREERGIVDGDGFVELQKSIAACDSVLQSVDKYLSSFQSDLGHVAAEIETLQQKSTTLNKRLAGRKEVERQLGPAIEKVIVPPAVVRKLSEGVIDDAYVEALEELDRSSDLRVSQDMKPLIEDLSNRAVERIRDYFASQIRAIRSPNTNAQTIQQNGFLRFKPLYAFLARKQPQLADDILQAYCNTMRWYYQSHFLRYQTSLAALKLQPAELLGDAKNSVALGKRLNTLKTVSSTAMPSHAADESKTTHHIETPFLAMNLAVIDNGCFEYLFLAKFFHQPVARHFLTIFGPVTSLASSFTKALIDDTLDALGILLMVRLNQQFAFMLQKRKVPVLEGYINGTNILLWPRFQTILDANCTSIKNINVRAPGAATLAALGGSTTTAPHPLTQRFSTFVRGIIDLSADDSDEPVANSLGRLRNEYDAFLQRLAATVRDKQRLLSNNYSLVLAILNDASGRLAEDTRQKFQIDAKH